MKGRTVKIMALLLTAVMGISVLTGCTPNGTDSGTSGTAETTAAGDTANDEADDDAGDTASDAATGEKQTINLWSYTDEVPNMVKRYLELNPEFAEKYEVKETIIATTEGAYQPALDQALLGGADAPDIYAAESAFVLKYTQGDMASYALPYAELGIDVDAKIEEAQIAPYTIDIGKRDDEVVGLGFQATGGAVIYRRSLAQDVWGTDDPAEVGAKIGPGWDKFMSAAEEMKEKGYAMVSGGGDLWQVIRNTGAQPWIVDDKLVIDPAREGYLDLHKTLYDNGYMNDTTAWSDAWFADMSGSGEREVFSFFGPAWLINYVMAGNAGETAGDWAVAVPPEGFFWGGTWLLANKDGNPDVKDGVAELIEWITLDSSDDGLQYHWANGTLFEENGTKDAVGSGAVMERSNGELEFLDGQNMFDIFIEAGEYANGKILTQYDETINQYFSDYSTEYATGAKTKEEAIAAFKQQVADNLGIAID